MTIHLSRRHVWFILFSSTLALVFTTDFAQNISKRLLLLWQRSPKDFGSGAVRWDWPTLPSSDDMRCTLPDAAAHSLARL